LTTGLAILRRGTARMRESLPPLTENRVYAVCLFGLLA
jgi:hypothetical protein